MSNATPEIAHALERWNAIQAELTALQAQLCSAMLAAAENSSELPRDLVIATERKRMEADAQFQVALDMLDARSPVKTGMTGFGTL